MNWGPRAALIAVVLALNLPFLFQPFHIDDRVYLEIADNAIQKPLFPYDYPPLFEGIVTPDAASHSHLPLLSYYLAAVRLLSGSDREWVYHLAFLIFPILLVVSFQGLASRYLRRPFWASLLLMGSPGVLVLSHTLMSEVPLLALWVLAIDRTLWILETGGKKRDWILLAAALLAASMMTVLSAGLLLLLALVCLLEGRLAGFRRFEWRWILGLLALPLLLWACWYLRGYLHYDRFLLVRTVQHLDKRSSFSLSLLGVKALSFILCIGGAAFFPLFPLFSLRSIRISLPGLLTGLAGGAYQLLLAEWSLGYSLLFALLLAAGTVVLLGCCEVLLGRKLEAVMGNRAELQRYLLLFWLLGILAAAILVYPSGSVRYTMLAFPPLILSFLWACERKQCLSQKGLAAALTGTLVLSLSLSWADFEMASLYKREAHQLAQEFERPDRTVWFTAEWEFRYYLKKEGARILSRIQVGPKAGDILIKPNIAFPYQTLYDGSEYVRFLERRPAGAFPYIRLMDFKAHAGFYSTAWGILPYSISWDDSWESFVIFEVKKLYDGPIPEPEKHY